MDVNERVYRASEEAADWWALLQGEELTREEREAFIDWLRDSQTNIAEMLRLAQVHGALEQFQQWAEISTDGAGSQADVIPLPPPRRSNAFPSGEDGRGPRPGGTMWRVAFAATITAAVIVGIFMLSPWRGQVIVTERGERREVVLEDGSRVQVDPQTRLSVLFETSIRRVVLTEGRAVFHVAKNAGRPFVVEAEDTTVRAVGTAFGVERRGRDFIVVTVAEGRVAVSGSGSTLVRTATPAEATSASSAPIYLRANQQIAVQGAFPSAPVRDVSSARELAWADGRLVFKDEPVSKVVAEFNRYNQVQLHVTDAALAARPVSGVFNAANPEAFIAFIQTATPVRIERDETRSIVISPDVSH